jgi:integrase-like protein
VREAPIGLENDGLPRLDGLLAEGAAQVVVHTSFRLRRAPRAEQERRGRGTVVLAVSFFLALRFLSLLQPAGFPLLRALPPASVLSRPPLQSASSPWLFPNEAGKPLHIANVRDRAWRSALRRAELRYRSFYQTRHTFVTLMLEAGESPAWIARQLGHTTPEMLFRRYHRFIPDFDAPGRVGGDSVAARARLVSGERDSFVTIKGRGATDARNPPMIGAADRIRTGDVQLGKLAFCH